MSLHLGKTESILFGTKIRLSSAEKFEVTCDGKIINPTNSVKYLGITLDEDLSSESVATSVIRKVCGRLCFLYRQGHFLNERSRRTLCTAPLQCHFDYCCSSWFASLSTKLKNKLQVMQNKMVRFILKLGPRSHTGDEELKTVGMLKVEDDVIDNLNLIMSLRSTMKLHQSTWILTSPNLSTPTGTISGAVQPIFLFQKLRVSSAILFSIRVLGNGICYQLKSRPAKLILNLKRQSKATFCPNYVSSFIFCRCLISKIKLEDFFHQHSSYVQYLFIIIIIICVVFNMF